LKPDGSYTKLDNEADGLLSAHEYFMQNPSLSGQGSLAPKSIDENEPDSMSQGSPKSARNSHSI